MQYVGEQLSLAKTKTVKYSKVYSYLWNNSGKNRLLI